MFLRVRPSNPRLIWGEFLKFKGLSHLTTAVSSPKQVTRKFEGSYRMSISKISSDLSGRIGEILEL